MTELQNKWKRLALAKSEFPAILKDAQAFGYKYAKLEQVIQAVEPILHKYDLDLLQTVINGSVLTYLVDLVNGEKELVGDITIDTSVVLAKMNTYQVYGSAISYFRRYEILACLGLAQEDDDAQGEQIKHTPVKKELSYSPISLATTMQHLKELYLLKKDKVPEGGRKELEKYFAESTTQENINKAHAYLKGL